VTDEKNETESEEKTKSLENLKDILEIFLRDYVPEKYKKNFSLQAQHDVFYISESDQPDHRYHLEHGTTKTVQFYYLKKGKKRIARINIDISDPSSYNSYSIKNG